MHRFSLLIAIALGTVAFAGLCHAQAPSPTTLDIDLDARARFAGIGKSNADLHTASLRLKTDLAPDLRLEVYAARKYGSAALQQAEVEKTAGAQRFQVGLIRLPFGIYDTRETYASGLIDYPMPRGDYAYHSVDWGVPGAQWTGGTPRLQIEAAAFDGRSAGVWCNSGRTGGAAIRLQTYVGGAILGASRWDGYEDAEYVTNSTVHLNGFDLRFTRPHLLLRGEYLFGMLAGDQMHGWYLDTYYHLPRFEKWTLVARWEQLRPSSSDPVGRQITAGARYVLSPEWILAVNWRHNNGPAYTPHWDPTAGKHGDVYVQIYRKLEW